jgi:Tfp pilus assembly protein PilX
MNREIIAPAPRSSERGIALVLSLFLVMAMSVIAASVMFIAQTETYGTMNYRMMSQARYAAESGVHKAVNYLLNDYASVKPTTASDLAVFDMTVSPVKYNGKAVVLSAVSSTIASNYPVVAVNNAFAAAGHGTLPVGTAAIQYGAYATLMSMQLTESNEVVQRWEITATGTVGGSRPATEEVTATLETQIVPTHGYSAFATAAACGAITLQGGAVSDSFDSTTYTGNGSTPPTTTAANGDIGTNGNLSEGGNGTVINGSLYTPRTGVGNCNNGNITALTSSGGATVTGGIVEMPQTWTPPTPTIVSPNPAPPTTAMNIDGTTTCASLASSLPGGATCSVVSTGGVSYLTINPNGATVSWGNVSVTNGAKITFLPGTYNFNSLTVKQNTTWLNIGDPRPAGTVGIVSGAVTMTLVGASASTTVDISSSGTLAVPSNRETSFVMNIVTQPGNNVPVNVTGGGFVNQTYDPQLFSINYAGNNESTISGGAATAFVMNSPNADLTLTGGSDFYGSLIVKKLKDTGGTKLHYDRNLGSFFGIAGNPLLTSFSWKRF